MPAPVSRNAAAISKQAGFIRIATPDFARICGMRAAQSEPGVAAYLAWSRQRYSVTGPGPDAAYVINSLFYHHSHRFLFDAATLSAALIEAGFLSCAMRPAAAVRCQACRVWSTTATSWAKPSKN